MLERQRAHGDHRNLTPLTFNDAGESGPCFSDLIGKKGQFFMIPPFYTTRWVDISIGLQCLCNIRLEGSTLPVGM